MWRPGILNTQACWPGWHRRLLLDFLVEENMVVIQHCTTTTSNVNEVVVIWKNSVHVLKILLLELIKFGDN